MGVFDNTPNMHILSPKNHAKYLYKLSKLIYIYALMSILSISGQEQVQGPKVQETITKYKERAEIIKK